MAQLNDEPQALIDFCLDQCQEPECEGTDGCYAYKCKQAELLGLPAPPKPKRGPYKKHKEKPLELPPPSPVVIMKDAAEIIILPVSAEKEALQKINAAIEALDAALEVIPNNKWEPAFIEAPEQLRRYRSEAYGHLVDWNAIAGGGLTAPNGGGV